MPAPSGLQWITGDSASAVFYPPYIIPESRPVPVKFADMNPEQQAVVSAFIAGHATFEPENEA